MAEVEILALNLIARRKISGLFIFRIHCRDKTGLGIGQRHAAFRTLWTRKRRHHIAKIEIERIGEFRIRRCPRADKALCLGVFLNQINARLLAAGHGEIG